jgi:ribosomal protein L34
MKINVRSSNKKHRKKTGYRTRQKTKGGRKVNARQRRRKAGRGKTHPA